MTEGVGSCSSCGYVFPTVGYRARHRCLATYSNSHEPSQPIINTAPSPSDMNATSEKDVEEEEEYDPDFDFLRIATCHGASHAFMNDVLDWLAYATAKRGIPPVRRWSTQSQQ